MKAATVPAVLAAVPRVEPTPIVPPPIVSASLPATTAPPAAPTPPPPPTDTHRPKYKTKLVVVRIIMIIGVRSVCRIRRLSLYKYKSAVLRRCRARRRADDQGEARKSGGRNRNSAEPAPPGSNQHGYLHPEEATHNVLYVYAIPIVILPAVAAARECCDVKLRRPRPLPPSLYSAMSAETLGQARSGAEVERIWSKVHCCGALSGRQRRNRVPCRKRPLLTWS
jgi:hypothetical protein